jgi:hypothetical protein
VFLSGGSGESLWITGEPVLFAFILELSTVFISFEAVSKRAEQEKKSISAANVIYFNRED